MNDQFARMPNGTKKRQFKSREFRRPQGFEHDDRMPPGGAVLRKVSFKSNGKQNRQKGWDNKIRAAYMDEDIDMQGHQGGPSRHHKFKGGAGGFKGRTEHRRLTESATYWYRVHIKYGHKYDKDYLLKVIHNFIKPVPFDPIGYTVSGEEASFVVGEYKTAEAVLQASHKITLSNGWRLQMRVRPITPLVELDDVVQVAIKEALVSRYDLATKSLNLESFHKDGAFAKRSIFCPLNRPNIMTCVLNTIGDCAPDLRVFSLCDNKINATEHMKIMIEKVPHLKSLHLGRNKLRDIKALIPLKGLGLTELVLDGNPLCDRFKEQEVYVRMVRDIFPRVVRLDQVELPAPILFLDEEEVTVLPPSRASFFSHPEGANIVKQFLQQYYRLYDTDVRQPISQAYHDEAEFSLNLGPHPDLPSSYPDNRNLLKCPIERRVKTLKKGRHNIAHFLESLPATAHDPSSFLVDLVLFSPQVIQVAVSGVYKDRNSKKNSVRSFSRVFVIVPMATGFCITNEMLTIAPPTEDQLRRLAQDSTNIPDAAVSALSNISISSKVPTLPIVPAATPDTHGKQMLVRDLATKTGMNLMWAEKCLNETGWDNERAASAFAELHQRGAIPAEAFT